jgi:hypothetical protein
MACREYCELSFRQARQDKRYRLDDLPTHLLPLAVERSNVLAYPTPPSPASISIISCETRSGRGRTARTDDRLERKGTAARRHQLGRGHDRHGIHLHHLLRERALHGCGSESESATSREASDRSRRARTGRTNPKTNQHERSRELILHVT